MNVGKIIKEDAEKYGDKPAIIFKEKEISFRGLYSRVNKMSNAMIKTGIKKGDRVAIYLTNSPEYVISYLAAFNIGAVATPLDTVLKRDGLISLLNHSEAKLLITRPSKAFSPEDLLDGIPSLKDIIINGEGEGRVRSFDSIMLSEPDDRPDVEIRDEDPSVLQYSSGTTGVPKGILWNYRHLDAAPKIMDYFWKFNDRDVKLSAVPFSHSGGLVYLQNCIAFGITLVLMDRFSPLAFLKNIERYGVTCFHIVPSMFIAMLQLKDFEKFDLSSLRCVTVFGAPSEPELLEKFGEKCPQAVLMSGYGLTETAPPNTLHPLNRVKRGSVGMAAPWTDMKIFDTDDQEAPTGEVGEIVFKGWVVMEGYYKEPQLTSEVMSNGWFHTGDMGKVDEDGYLYIVGREKDMILVGGLVVYSIEVEGVINNHPGVVESGVIGIPDKLRGEVVKALVVPKAGESLKEKEIIAYCKEKLESFKVPKEVEFRDSLPKTTSGKIEKRSLR